MSTNKRLTHVMAGLLFLALLLSGCSHLETRSIDTDSRQVHSVTFTKSDRSHHDPFPEPIRTEDGWHMESATSPVRKYEAFPMAHGPVLITGAEDKEIISLDAGTGSVNWRLTMSTGIGSEESIAATPQTGVPTHQVVVSPNGRYLAIRTHSYLAPEDSENIGDQRVGITVLDAETGQEVRTVQVSGLVLGQALTDGLDLAMTFIPLGAAGAGSVARTTARDMAASRTALRQGGKKAAQATEQAAARTEAQRVAESQAAHTHEPHESSSNFQGQIEINAKLFRPTATMTHSVAGRKIALQDS